MKEMLEMYLQEILINDVAGAKVCKLSDCLKYFDDEKFCAAIEWCYYQDFDLKDLYECVNNVLGGIAA